MLKSVLRRLLGIGMNLKSKEIIARVGFRVLRLPGIDQSYDRLYRSIIKKKTERIAKPRSIVLR